MSGWGPGCFVRLAFVTVIELVLFGSGNFWLRSVVFWNGYKSFLINASCFCGGSVSRIIHAIQYVVLVRDG